MGNVTRIQEVGLSTRVATVLHLPSVAIHALVATSACNSGIGQMNTLK